MLDLTISNPTQAFSDYPHAEIRRAYGKIDDFRYEPNPLGAERARAAIAESQGSRGVALRPDRLVLTASTSEAYSVLFKLLCDPGDEVLAPLPSYPLFEYLAALESIRIVPYRLLYDGGWFIDFQKLRERISDSTRAIVVVIPNNPTGSFLKRHELDLLMEIARQKSLPIISDEVFMDYGIGADAGRIKTLIGCDSLLSFSLNGLSKSAGMPQMKLAWISINGPLKIAETTRQRLELILDTYLSVSTPVQAALPELLTIGAGLRDQIAERTRRNAESLDRLLKDSAAHPLHVEGGWSAIIQLPKTMTEEAWVIRLVEEQGVIVQPGFFFDMHSEPHAVISLITSPQDFEEGIRRLRLLTT